MWTYYTQKHKIKLKVDDYIKMAARKTKLTVDWIVTTTGHS